MYKQVQRLVSFLAAFFTSACCISLPKLPPKSEALPDLQGTQSIEETTVTWHDAKRSRDVPARIYRPRQPLTVNRQPVIIFSHGIGEDRDSYAWLGRALARSGFVAVHLTHSGTDRAVLERGYRHLYRATKDKQNWINRPFDVSFAIDQLASLPYADIERVSVVGHSAGAFTAFAVAGVTFEDGSSARDPRVKRAVAISMPRLGGAIPDRGYDTIAIPVLNVTGTCDTSVIYRTFPRDRRIPFERSRAREQYLVTLEGMSHDIAKLSESGSYAAALRKVIVAFLRDEREWFVRAGVADIDGVRAALERTVQ